MRKVNLLFFLLLFSLAGYNQYVLTGLNYSQDFNSLASAGTSAAMPAGWYFLETGVNADITYTAGTGSDNTADTYSFGSAASTERALGGLRSSALVPNFGFWMTNNTGNTINAIIVSYTGEQWRLGATGRSDRLDFQYSLDATTLNTGTWTDLSALDFASPTIAGPTGALDGNLAANRTFVGTVINGLNIPVGGTIFFRWFDLDIAGSEDGLSIDDLSLVITTAIPASTDHYRSIATGVWSNPLVWETSATGTDPWVAAIVPPTSAANTITIRNGHTVTIDATTSADQLTIQNGGILIYSAGTFTIDDGAGDDVSIQNGGIFTLALSGTIPAFSGLANVNIATGAILRVAVAGITAAGAGVHSSNFVYQHQSVLEYATNLSFSSSNVTFFPNVDAVTIPIFRTTSNLGLIGGNNNTTINGVFEANGTITFDNIGQKIFRNGIRGMGNISVTADCGKFIINGITAEIGGTGTLAVPITDGLEIGSATGTTVTVTSDKTVTGNINLLSTNTYVELGANDLTVTGTISGGSTASYIRTNANGVLQLMAITTARTVPVGNSRYNPVIISNGSNLDWSFRVEDVLVVDDPVFATNTAGAVQREWHITPSTNPPPGGADIVFQYDDGDPTQIGAAFNTASNVQVWHEVDAGSPWGLDWVAVNVAQTPTGTPGGVRTASISNWTQFSPFAISTLLYPLPIKLMSFNSVKLSETKALITWELAACCSSAARFEVEKSEDSRNYIVLSGIPGSETNRFYSVTDTRLAKGITWYRLKMIDADGKVSYSKVVAIINDNKGVLISTISPNPVHSQAVVTISTAKAGTIHFCIYDIAGRMIKQWQVPASEGSNRIIMNLDGLQAGVYHLVASGDEAKTSYRFVKQ